MAEDLRLSEKEIYEACYTLLVKVGCSAYRLSQSRASQQTPGLPDLIAFVHSFRASTMLTIEVKTSDGRQSEAQKRFGNDVRMIGFHECVAYVVVRSAQELADIIADIRQGHHR